MFVVETYAAVRRFVFLEGHSQREASRVFGLSRDTIAKMCRYSAPPGYVRTRPPDKPKLGALVPVIAAILEADRAAPPKQQHTAKRIFERLRDEHGYGGGYTVVKDHVRRQRVRGREVFVPLAHPPGHAQVDFGEAEAVIGGVRQKVHFFCLDLPQSDACFVKVYPRETTEAFLDGHVSAFAFFGGVPRSILYDNLKLAVARICGDGKRERTRAFTGLVSHYLFQDRFGRPGKGNDKGKVEGLVKFSRANFLTPVQIAASYEALNALLAERCRLRQSDRAGRHAETIGARLAADLAALQRLPGVSLEPCETISARVSSTALVRYRGNDYSVPTAHEFQAVLVKGFVDAVVILCDGTPIARHVRMLANAMRGQAAEFGLVVAKGVHRLDELEAQVQAEVSMPATAKQAFAEMHRQSQAAATRIAGLEAQIVAHARQDATARRLATIPGIGPITASLITATVGDAIGSFKSARHSAAWLGLVPRQHSTGGKTRLGRITKAGNGDIRRLLVLGATSMVFRAGQWNSAAGAWLRGVLERRPVRLATVALANKMARIAWAVMTRSEVYQAKGRAPAAAAAVA